MASRNGYLVIIEQDVNPNSISFGQTRESEVYDTDSCPLQDANWQLTSSYCQVDESGAQNGNRVDVYTDLNPASDTYMETQEQVIPDSATCPKDDNTAEWVLVGSECEIKTYNNGKVNNSGFRLDTYTDMNEFSSSFDTSKVERIEDSDTCPAPDTNPNWLTISKSCNSFSFDGQIFFDGTSTAIQQDINEWSDTFNTIRDYVSEDSECEVTIGRLLFGGNNNNLSVFDCTGDTWTNTFIIRDETTLEETTIIMDKENINTVLMMAIPNRDYTLWKNDRLCSPTSQPYDRLNIYINGVNINLSYDNNNGLNLYPVKFKTGENIIAAYNSVI